MYLAIDFFLFNYATKNWSGEVYIIRKTSGSMLTCSELMGFSLAGHFCVYGKEIRYERLKQRVVHVLADIKGISEVGV